MNNLGQLKHGGAFLYTVFSTLHQANDIRPVPQENESGGNETKQGQHTLVPRERRDCFEQMQPAEDDRRCQGCK